MNRTNKLILLIAVVIAILTLLVAASEMGLLTDTNNYDVNLTELNEELTLDMSNWNYDEKNNIYYFSNRSRPLHYTRHNRLQWL